MAGIAKDGSTPQERQAQRRETREYNELLAQRQLALKSAVIEAIEAGAMFPHIDLWVQEAKEEMAHMDTTLANEQTCAEALLLAERLRRNRLAK